MNYEQYHQKDGFYVIPVEIFDGLCEEKDELQKENQKLKDEIYKSNAVADTNIELAEKYYKEKQELVNYLKSKDTDLKENVVGLEEKLRNTSRDSFYYNSYLKTLHRFRAKRELIKEILSKIEKSDK